MHSQQRLAFIKINPKLVNLILVSSGIGICKLCTLQLALGSQKGSQLHEHLRTTTVFRAALFCHFKTIYLLLSVNKSKWESLGFRIGYWKVVSIKRTFQNWNDILSVVWVGIEKLGRTLKSSIQRKFRQCLGLHEWAAMHPQFLRCAEFL